MSGRRYCRSLGAAVGLPVGGYEAVEPGGQRRLVRQRAVHDGSYSKKGSTADRTAKWRFVRRGGGSRSIERQRRTLLLTWRSTEARTATEDLTASGVNGDNAVLFVKIISCSMHVTAGT